MGIDTQRCCVYDCIVYSLFYIAENHGARCSIVPARELRFLAFLITHTSYAKFSKL